MHHAALLLKTTLPLNSLGDLVGLCVKLIPFLFRNISTLSMPGFNPKTHNPIDSMGLKSEAWYELLTSGPLATWVNPFLRAISP
ncbi:MAG: hypothetical protein RLZZ408_1943 [Verrucomicrobiota bacterium]